MWEDIILKQALNVQSPISEKADLEGGGAVQTELYLKRAHKTREVVDKVGHPELGGGMLLSPRREDHRQLSATSNTNPSNSPSGRRGLRYTYTDSLDHINTYSIRICVFRIEDSK